MEKVSTYNKIRKSIFRIIGPSKKGDVASIIYDISLCLIIILSSLAVIIELIGVSEELNRILLTFEYCVVGFFALEYLLKCWTADLLYPECKSYIQALKEFIVSFDSLIDIISILSILLNEIPKELSIIGLLRLLKLVRLVKMTDYFNKNNKVSRLKGIQKRVHEIITKDTDGDIISKIYDISITILIFLSIIIVVIETFEIGDNIRHVFLIIEICIALLFTLEYIIRVWVAPLDYPKLSEDKARMTYIFSFMSLVDILSIVPVFVIDLPTSAGVVKIFKLCKILRIAKASRYIGGIAMFGEAISKKKKAIIFSIVVLALLIVLSSVLLYTAENSSQPDVFTNAFSGLYYSFASLTAFDSVDVTPITTLGKVLQMLMSIFGVCVVGVPTAIIAEEFAKMVEIKAGSKEEEEQTDINTPSKDRLITIIKTLPNEEVETLLKEIENKAEQ